MLLCLQIGARCRIVQIILNDTSSAMLPHNRRGRRLPARHGGRRLGIHHRVEKSLEEVSPESRGRSGLIFPDGLMRGGRDELPRWEVDRADHWCSD
jgi:hypothetical protein